MANYEQNLLLGSLPAESLERLSTYLTPVKVATGADLYEPGQEMIRVFFPLDCVVSNTTVVSGTMGEVATIGCEGVVALPVVFGTNSTHLRSFLQIGGNLAAAPSDAFSALIREDAVLRGLILRYMQALFLQVGQSVVCNQRHSLLQRCARWLLMTRDRVPGNEFHLTHEFLAAMLGVRRAGVTVAAGELQRAGLIHYRRGSITILDRAGLERVSCECYGVVCRAYNRLVGVPIGPGEAAAA